MCILEMKQVSQHIMASQSQISYCWTKVTNIERRKTKRNSVMLVWYWKYQYELMKIYTYSIHIQIYTDIEIDVCIHTFSSSVK